MNWGLGGLVGPGTPKTRCARPAFGLAAAVLLGLCAAACTAGGPQPTAVSAVRGPTVAFESIDGPPESIFSRLVANLSAEAEARQLSVVSREAPAQYRIRAYAATIVHPKRSVVSWVWDIYDADQKRVLRITGEEPVSGAGRTTWAAADDQVVRRMTRNGMDRLAAFLGAPNREPDAAPVPESRGRAVASAPQAGATVAYLPASR